MVDKNIEQELRQYRNAVVHGLTLEEKWSQINRDYFLNFLLSKLQQNELLRSEVSQIQNERLNIIHLYNLYQMTKNEDNKKQEIVECKDEVEQQLIILKAKNNKVEQKKAKETQVFQNLIIVIPEEYVVDLKDLYQQLIEEKRSTWVIRITMLRAFLEMLWVFYIRIKVENIWLPQNKARKKIDD